MAWYLPPCLNINTVWFRRLWNGPKVLVVPYHWSLLLYHVKLRHWLGIWLYGFKSRSMYGIKYENSQCLWRPLNLEHILTTGIWHHFMVVVVEKGNICIRTPDTVWLRWQYGLTQVVDSVRFKPCGYSQETITVTVPWSCVTWLCYRWMSDDGTYTMSFHSSVCKVAKIIFDRPANFACEVLNDVLSVDFRPCQPNTKLG